uniref:Putative secreted protein n=1 Tax=Anopheles marajoara TaxID=58244 RepID=A0A2M4CBI0_9DIPT
MRSVLWPPPRRCLPLLVFLCGVRGVCGYDIVGRRRGACVCVLYGGCVHVVCSLTAPRSVSVIVGCALIPASSTSLSSSSSVCSISY